MQPPLKRPRLSMFSRDLPPDETLSRARWRNDLSLKSRFEAIFEKYAHDFTGIGDEIDVATGTVVVNNGHLEAMENEGDTGAAVSPSKSPLKRPGNINGGSLLRAMTVAPEDQGLSFEDVNDDDIVMSIEAMAENAALYSEDDDDDDDDDAESRNAEDYADASGIRDVSSEEDDNSSDEELFQTADNTITESLNEKNSPLLKNWPRTTENREQASVDGDVNPEIAVKQEDQDYWREGGSLIRNRDTERSSSPDSLFEIDKYPSGFPPQETEQDDPVSAYPEIPNISREVSDDAILDKFGPKIGPQVIDVLTKRRAMMEAHIEPAWRVPDIGVVFPKPKPETPPPDVGQSQEANSGKRDSIWSEWNPSSRPARRDIKYTTARTVRGSSQLSNESEDPLQEGFHEAKDADRVSQEADFEISLDDLHDGICPFCQKQFSVRGSVYVHWDELIKKGVRDDVHDMAYIKDQRRRKRHRSQFPKVTVQDFHTIIKLREVDKLDWQEIYNQGFFGQRPATSLQSIYYQYRTLAKTDEELAAESRLWTAEEDDKLLGFCEDPTITFQKLRKLMRNRPQAELGNRLATIWMQEYETQDREGRHPQVKVNSSCKIARRRLPSILKPGRIRPSSLESDSLRRSWSSDSMDSLFQLGSDAEDSSAQNDSDDGLFGTA
jgi:hypothetical protein